MKNDDREEVDQVERWLQIHEFPRYSVSNMGRVRNDDTERIMAQVRNGAGVMMVFMVRDGKQYTRGVAKLVAKHFLPHNTAEHFDTPMHRDGDRTNNAAENLVWRPRWYATKYLRQFEEFRPPYVPHKMVETQTGLIFENSWHATTYFGLLETEVARSYHAWQSRGEDVPASPTNYYFRAYDQ
jgi:hypothetical protein